MQFKLNFDNTPHVEKLNLMEENIKKEVQALFEFYKNPETVNLNFDDVLEDLKKLSEGRWDEGSLSEKERSLGDMASYYYKDFKQSDFLQLYNEVLQKISDDNNITERVQNEEKRQKELDANPFNLTEEELKRYNESDARDLYRDRRK